MKLSHDIEITLRGQSVTFAFRASAPDRSVGLFGHTLEEWRVLGEDGAVLDWELTETELEAIQPQVDEYMNAWELDDGFDDPDNYA